MNFSRSYGKPAVPFVATREFRWLVGILVVVAVGLGVVVFEILPQQRSLQAQLDSGPSSESDFLPRKRESRIPRNSELEEALKGARDSTPIQAIDPPYRALLRHLQGIPAELMAQESLQIEHKLLAKTPDQFRGRPILLTAMVLDWKPVALVPPEGGIDLVYRTFLLDTSGNEAYVVDLLEKPATIEQRDVVSADALFLKLGLYETAKEMVQAPVLLSRSIRPVQRVYAKNVLEFKGMLISICVLSAALLILTIWFQRQSSARRRSAVQRPKTFLQPSQAQPWEGFVERQWKAAGVHQLAPRVLRRSSKSAAGSRLRIAPLAQTKRWIALAGLVSLILFGWTVYRIWRDTRPPQPIVLDLEAEAAQSFSRASEARRVIADVQGKVEDPSQPIATTDVPVVEEALKRLENAAVRLQGFLEYARASVQNVPAEFARVRGQQLLRIQLWIFDASGVLDSSRGTGAPGGFFLPFRAIAETRRRAADLLSKLESTGPDPNTPAAKGDEAVQLPRQSPSEEASALVSAVGNALKRCAELEDALRKDGLWREPLESADLPELAELQIERDLLVQQRDRASKFAVHKE